MLLSTATATRRTVPVPSICRPFRLGSLKAPTFRYSFSQRTRVSRGTSPRVGVRETYDMAGILGPLPQARRVGLEDLIVEHSYWYSRVQGGGPEPTEEERVTRPPARHRLVHLHEPSGRKALYLASHASDIVGMARDEARALIKELMDFAVQPQFVYAHKWRQGDVLIWDNLATMHRATPFDDRNFVRDMRRTTCREKAVETADSLIA